jgi:hypothetical protein
MRAQRDKRVSQKVETAEADQSWELEVERLTREDPESLELQKLKALLVVLVSYLALAPSFESQQRLQAYISSVRASIVRLTQPDLSICPEPSLDSC